MSGIAQSYGYQNAQKLYETYHKSYSAYADYWEQAADYQQQKTVISKRAKGKIDFWLILNNFLMINAKECVIIDLWHIVKINLFFATSRGEQNCLGFLRKMKSDILISSGGALVLRWIMRYKRSKTLLMISHFQMRRMA